MPICHVQKRRIGLSNAKTNNLLPLEGVGNALIQNIPFVGKVNTL